MKKNNKKLIAFDSPAHRDGLGRSGNNKGRVVVAMSGGVDSSVAAAMLKKHGYDVVGVFMRFWMEPRISRGFKNAPLIERGSENSCCSEGAEQAARDVAAKLEIPFYILNVQKEFKKAVVDYFLAEEKKGRTPNPCVVCNKKIKFGLLFEKAIAMGADFVATGHYARNIVVASPASSGAKQSRGKQLLSGGIATSLAATRLTPRNDTTYGLFRAKDADKDQSYFLYTLTQKQLSRILFPLGDYTKDEVYALAKKWRLPYRKDESFDLCFVAKDRESFIKRYVKMKEGRIIGREGELLGVHQGLALYTIGQRKNVPVGQGPWWVVKKDEHKNILYVTDDEKDLYSKELIAKNVNWLSGRSIKLPAKILAKIRYKSEAAEAVVSGIASPAARERRGRNDMVRVIFIKSQRAITPGQSVVFYGENSELLGGGVIGS